VHVAIELERVSWSSESRPLTVTDQAVAETRRPRLRRRPPVLATTTAVALARNGL